MLWSAILPLVAVAYADVRGVPPEKQSLYKPNSQGNWACLNNPEIEIPFDRVNDDYCDCPDGSDEPGTSACSNGVFYCANKGHIPAYIPSSRVNDGVCDYDVCCDGSDENTEFVKCPNKCAEIHADYVKKRKQEAEKLSKGLEARKHLVKQASDAKDAIQKDIIAKDKDLGRLQEQLDREKEQLDDAIAKDREEKLAKGLSEDQLDMPAEIADVVEKLKALTAQRQEALKRVESMRRQFNELVGIIDQMKTGYNPNFNDAAVKEALRSFDDLKSRQENIAEIRSSSPEMDAIVAQLEAYRPGTSGSSNQRSLLPESAQHYVGKLKQWAVENGLLAKSSGSDSSSGSGATSSTESERVRVARTRVEKTESDIDSLKQQVNGMMEDLQKDYGQDEVLRALKDKCVKNHIGEYDYEVCFYGSSSQSGNGHTSNLGSFERFGFEDGGILKFEYENGSRCWNGPIRRSIVRMECGEENRIVTVSEPEKCEYHFRIMGPAACKEKEGGEGDQEDVLIVHNEL